MEIRLFVYTSKKLNKLNLEGVQSLQDLIP